MLKLRHKLSLLVLFAALACSALYAESSRKVVHRVAPAYPATARQFHVSGVVKLLVTVAADGSVREPRVLGGHPMLTGAAVSAVSQWKYEPGTETVETVEVAFNAN